MDHLKLLSEAAFLLHKSIIVTDNLHTARDLFYRYIQKFQETFRKEKMTYNIDLLNHLTDTPVNWGPLWANSFFPFESFNKKITDSVTSSNERPLQIMTRFLMRKFVEGIVEDKESPETMKHLIKSILTSANRNAWENVAYEAPAINTEIQILGTSVHRAPTRKEQIILSNNNYTPTNIINFKKAFVKKIK